MMAIVAPLKSAVAPLNSPVPLNNLYAIKFVVSRLPKNDCCPGSVGKPVVPNRLISISTEVKLDAAENAPWPMVVTLFGMVIEVKLDAPENASSPMMLREESASNITVVKLVAP